MHFRQGFRSAPGPPFSTEGVQTRGGGAQGVGGILHLSKDLNLLLLLLLVLVVVWVLGECWSSYRQQPAAAAVAVLGAAASTYIDVNTAAATGGSGWN